MQLAYPIIHMLFYIAMWFAPPDAERVSITGPDGVFELARASGEWKFTGKEASGTASFKDGKTILTVKGEVSDISVVTFISSAIGHDWAKQPKVRLQDQNTLEKTADGFVLRTDDGRPSMKEYRITYHRGGGEHKPISVNVLGRVKQPGTYQIAAGTRVPAAVAAAGGLTEKADRLVCRILRGEAGTIAKTIDVPWEAILNPAADGPVLQDRDTVYLEIKKGDPNKMAANAVTITLAADGALTLAGQPCPLDQLGGRLKALVGEEAVMIRLQADKKTPARQVASVLDACTASGIKDITFSAESP